MTYQEFENKWLGGRVDYDGVYQYQCVDLVKQYLYEVFDMRPGAWGNAIDYWTKTNSNLLTKFDKVTGTPKTGDIVIYNGTSGNIYGHIGIAKNATQTLEQNGSTGNGSGTGKDAIRLRSIPTSRIAGILRPKGKLMATITKTTLNQLAQGMGGKDAPSDVVKHWTTQDTSRLSIPIKDIYNSNWAKEFRSKAIKHDELVKALKIKDNEIKRLQAQVGTPVDEKQVVEGWLKRLWQSFFKKG